MVQDHEGEHSSLYAGIQSIAAKIGCSGETLRNWIRQADPAKLPPRAKSDAALKIEIRRVFEANVCVYGVGKVWRQLGREGNDIAHCTVARRLRIMGLRGVVRGRKVRTTVPNPAAACPLDRVNRQFKAPRPNALWVSDFTYVATWVGFDNDRLRHRRLRPPHRRLARFPNRPCRLRARRSGAGPASASSSPGQRSRAS